METLSTTSGELVFQLASILISVVVTALGAYLKNWLTTSAFAKKYDLDNAITERVLANAVAYAEKKGKEYAKRGIEKRKFAFDYIEKIEPDLIKKHGDKLEMMIDRKVLQVLG